MNFVLVKLIYVGQAKDILAKIYNKTAVAVISYNRRINSLNLTTQRSRRKKNFLRAG